MTYQAAFPAFPAADLPAIPVTFVDISWVNDACPHFTSELLDLELWTDYADPTQREIPDSSRFLLFDADVNTIIATDDWSGVIEAIITHTLNLIETESNGTCDQAQLDLLNAVLEGLFEVQASQWTVADTAATYTDDAGNTRYRVVAWHASKDAAVNWLTTQDQTKVSRGDYEICGPA